MDMIFIEILQLNCYAVQELPPSRNPLHNCIACAFLHVHTGTHVVIERLNPTMC